MGFTLQNRFSKKFSCLWQTHLYLCCTWHSPNLLVKASNGKSIASKRWCLSEDKGSLLSQYCFFIYFQLKFKLLETPFVTHTKLGPCRGGSPMVVELNVCCPPPSPVPHHHSKKYWIYLSYSFFSSTSKRLALLLDGLHKGEYFGLQHMPLVWWFCSRAARGWETWSWIWGCTTISRGSGGCCMMKLPAKQESGWGMGGNERGAVESWLPELLLDRLREALVSSEQRALTTLR